MYGFAKAPGKFPFWPAKILTAMKTRIAVQFLGTVGDTMTIKKSAWLGFSEALYIELTSKKRHMKSAVYRGAMAELRVAIDSDNPEEAVETSEEGIKKKNSAAINKTKSSAGALKADRLENQRLFRITIVQRLGERKWRCRRCSFNTGYLYKAKSHARQG